MNTNTPAPPMVSYIGTKALSAAPMTRGDYNAYRGWNMPENENPDDPGYLVEYQEDGKKPTDPRHKGYISWSPKDVFEAAYRETEGLTFGLALEVMKMGHRVARAGWNGKGMWIMYVPGTPVCTLRPGTPYAKALPDLAECEILPHIDMWTVNADGRRAMLPGWLASQSDMLASDWMIV